MLYGVLDASNLIFVFQNSYENDTVMDICKHHFNTTFSKRLLASITPVLMVELERLMLLASSFHPQLQPSLASTTLRPPTEKQPPG